MTFELWMLAGAIVLGLLQIVASAHAASLRRGYRWTASARDDVVAPLTGVAGRPERALRNFGETFALFAAAVLIAHVAGRHSRLTEWERCISGRASRTCYSTPSACRSCA